MLMRRNISDVTVSCRDDSSCFGILTMQMPRQLLLGQVKGQLYAWWLCMYQRCMIVKHGTYTQNTGVLSTCYTRKAQSERSAAYHMPLKYGHCCGYNDVHNTFSHDQHHVAQFVACKLQSQAAFPAACAVGGQRRRGAHGVQAGAGGGAGVAHLCHEASPPEQAPGSAAAV